MDSSSISESGSSKEFINPCAGGWCMFFVTGNPPGSGMNLYWYPVAQKTPCSFGGLGGNCSCSNPLDPSININDYKEYDAVFFACANPMYVLSVNKIP